jgi:hypothetical protein
MLGKEIQGRRDRDYFLKKFIVHQGGKHIKIIIKLLRK